MLEMVPRTLLAALVLVSAAASTASAAPLKVAVTYVTQQEPAVQPLSLVEPILEDEGLMGARQALRENQTTGQFLQHDYQLIERIVPQEGDLIAEYEAALAAGERLFISDLRAEQLLQLAPLADAAGALLFNARAPDDQLRTESCHESVLHVAPSRAMKADALAQYLIWKQWPAWFLMRGTKPADVAYADAIKRAAARYGAKIVEEREYEFVEFARRTDSGHAQVQRQMPVLTQGVPEYDVLVVADESDVFGEYLPYRTWDPRPVAGTQGLVPTAWSRVHEQWGGTQVQRRFEKFSGRWMTERDYNAWLAVRIIGEAVTRTERAEAQALHDYMMSDAFEIAAFKGEGLNFRTWNQQLRQPILLVNPRVLVSVSPQEQFLHQRTPLDTLGYDEPESDCRLN
jgi:ABC transporter substrate binding protein (PQQ-dependent alcohol dehydrogenase system)